MQNRPLYIAFLDIDSTMTGSIKSTNAVRKKLENLGYAIVYVTARTEEMLMTSVSYKLSKEKGFRRPLPKLGRKADKYIYIPVERLEPAGLLDPDIIAASSGTQVLIQQKNGGYLPDTRFHEKLEVNNTWRKKINNLIAEFNTSVKKAYYALYEESGNYTKGLTNVYPPSYRITVLFQSAKIKNEFRSFIKAFLKSGNKFINIRLTDDSEPAKDIHQIHITPRNGSKTKAVDHIISQVCRLLTIKESQLHVLIAGDGHADFDMGMRAARGTCATFLLPGGSRLMPALRCKDAHPELFDNELEELKRSFISLGSKGCYISRLHKNRKLIICDEIEKNSKAVESIYSQLQLIDKRINQ